MLKKRLRPALLHLLGSAAIAGFATVLLVRLWYPTPYGQLAGGFELLTLLVVVDVMLGPALTFVVASPGKPLRVLARDLGVILTVQSAALAYGLYTLAIARPVGLVFEVDQMRVISAADVDPVALLGAPGELQNLSWNGPRLFAAVKPSDPNELVQAVQLGMAGVDLAMLPKHWRSYESQREAAWRVALPVDQLIQQRPSESAAVTRVAEAAGVAPAQLKVLPVRTRRSDDWVALLAAPDARVVALLRPGGSN